MLEFLIELRWWLLGAFAVGYLGYVFSPEYRRDREHLDGLRRAVDRMRRQDERERVRAAASDERERKRAAAAGRARRVEVFAAAGKSSSESGPCSGRVRSEGPYITT